MQGADISGYAMHDFVPTSLRQLVRDSGDVAQTIVAISTMRAEAERYLRTNGYDPDIARLADEQAEARATAKTDGLDAKLDAIDRLLAQR